ncbi:MAG: glycosyltransferase 87 family protein [Dehalococcoidales bacterium]|jgi:uncharacterized membrane protein
MSLKLRWAQFSGPFYLSVFGLALLLAAYIRFWAAPLSAGVDVPQFWAFAKVFDQYGLDFYRYADASLPIFPTAGWGFVYPPLWLLILRVALLAAPASTATNTMVDTSWRLAMKTPIIAADLAIGCLLFWAVPGPKWRKLIFASLWLFHPTAWYESAVFGQFDAIAAAFLLAAVILLEKGKDRLGFLFAGLAVMTKQHTLIPVAFMIAVSIRTLGWRRLAGDCAILAGVMLAFSIPFLTTGNFFEYGRSFFLAGQTPDYQQPLMYAFSGSGSLLTYLHQALGWDTKGLLVYSIPLLIAAILAGLWFSYKRQLKPSQAALVGFLIFLIFIYRTNYQYLIIYIPLALLVAAQTKFRSERIMALVAAMLPAVWLWIFNVAFWFYFLRPAHTWVFATFEHLALTHIVPDYGYMALAVTLMCLFIAYVICTFTKWSKPSKMLTPY